MWTRLKFEQNTWTRLIFRLKHVDWTNFRWKHVDLIKLSVFLPLQSDLCISTATFCFPSQIWILFGIHTDTLGASALISTGAPRRSSTPTHSLRLESYYTFYIIEIVKYNKIDFYSILILILRRFPGCVFFVISVIHGILVVVGGDPLHPRGLGAEEGGYPDGPPPPASVIDRAIFFVV